MKKRIIIVYSTHLPVDYNEKFEKHIIQTCGAPVLIHAFYNHNEFSLSEIYNRAISEIDQKIHIIL